MSKGNSFVRRGNESVPQKKQQRESEQPKEEESPGKEVDIDKLPKLPIGDNVGYV